MSNGHGGDDDARAPSTACRASRMAVNISLLRAHAPSVHSAAGGGMMRRDKQMSRVRTSGVRARRAGVTTTTPTRRG